MKKITLLLLIVFSLSAQRYAMSQITLTAGTLISTASVGGTVTVPISATVAATTPVNAITLDITFDPLITTPTLVTAGSILTGALFNYGVLDGVISISLYDATAHNIPTGTSVIFNVVFTKVATGFTDFGFSFDEFFLNGSDPYTCTPINGKLTYQPDAPHTVAPVQTACSGQSVSIPVLVSDFNTIGAVSLRLLFDPAVLTYNSSTINSGLALTITNLVSGRITVGGTISGGATLPNGTTLFTLNFTYKGGFSNLDWQDLGTTCEYGNEVGDALPDTPFANYYTNGSVGPSPSTWTGTTSTAWTTLGNWSCDVPTAYTDVTIGTSSNYPVIPAAANITVKSLAINAGSVTVSPTAKLTVTNALTNAMGNAGLVIKSDATGTGSLINTSADVPGTVERYISGSAILTANLYHQVSVPLAQSSNPTSNLFLDSYLYNFTESGDVSGLWNPLGNPTTTPLDVNKGYLIYYPNTSHLYTFAGPLRAGTVSPAITFTNAAHGFNLVPNPYPSAIDWTLTTRNNLADAIWIWNSAYQNYGAYGTITGGGTSSTTQFIAVGQSFFVRAIATSPVFTMEDADRVHNAQAFLKKAQTTENQLHLIVDGNHSRDEIVVAFNDNWSAATENADVSKMYGSEGSPQLNTVASDGSKLCIDARKFTDGDAIVPLNFLLAAATEVTFTASGLESFNAGTPIFLEDMMLNTTTDLRSNPVYRFNHSAGDTENRFRLLFNITTGILERPGITKGSVFVNGGILHIDIAGMQRAKANIALYDATGRQLSSHMQVILGQVQLAAPSAPGVYIVRVTGGNKTFTGKVIVN